MIPAQQRQRRMDAQQRQRNRTGTEWEKQLLDELDTVPECWARRWPKAWSGQPFDISAVAKGRPLAIECKSISAGNLRFSALRPNEIENLERFEAAGGTSVIAVRRLDPATVAFIPWRVIREAVLAGDRGSVPLGGYACTLQQFLGRWLP